MTSSHPSKTMTSQHQTDDSSPAADAARTNAQQTSPITRLPWTTGGLSPSAPNTTTDNYAMSNGHTGNSSGHAGDSDPQADIFSVSVGLMPEEIPNFPYPEPEATQSAYLLGQQSHSGPAQAPATIRPLAQAGSSAPIAPLTAPHLQPPHGVQGMPGVPSLGPAATQPNLVGQSNPAGTQPQLSQSMFNALAAAAAASNGSPNTGRLSAGMLFGGDKLATGYLDPLEALFPEPRSIEETGINQGLISDLVIKTMYFTSYLSGQELSAELRLPFYGVLDGIINLMKKEQLCEVSGTSGLGEAGYQYVLTVKGMERSHQVLTRSSYVGPCPVPLQRYIDVLKAQTSKKPTINQEVVENALRGLIIGSDLKDQIGSAVNAGKSLFLFGAPGNGKTLITEKIATMLGGYVAIPYALEADGQVIQLFDLNSHRPLVPSGANETDPTKAEFSDRRWLRVHRPVVVVGGELTMSSLDLIYNETAGFYEAPFQLKANGGLFLIDDFGRQQVSPQALLNRWIVPLEKSIDYLTLKTGKKLQVPFELFLVLSTNLQPEDLIDDAFLRRIQNKLNVPDPTAQQFYEIFAGQCKSMNVPFAQQGFTYLVTEYYMKTKRPFRASQPRDLLRQLTGIARYRNVPPEMTPSLLDAACNTYFVNTKPK